jgi:hypothetical protein
VRPELQRVSKAADKAASARGTFEQAIRDAHQAGVTIRDIARAAGLSSARIHQLLHGK